jgi:hypothetical protein
MTRVTRSDVRGPWAGAFLRSVRFGMIGFLLFALVLMPGPAQAVALEAVAVGIVVGLLGMLRRWIARGRLADFVAAAALATLITDGLQAVRLAGRRRLP